MAEHSQTPSPAQSNSQGWQNTVKHQALHSQTLRDGRTQSNTKPCTQSNSQGWQNTVKHQALHSQTLRDGRTQSNTKPCTVKLSGMAEHSQTPSPAQSNSQGWQNTVKHQALHSVKHIGKHLGMAVYNKLPLTAALNIASLSW